MELRQLKYFVKAAECLNFSEASRMLYITQSTLSQQIRQLEEEIGMQLFHRDSHSVNLTEAGEELLPYAIRTLKSADNCFDRMHDLQQLLTGTLNIGVTYSFSPILTETLLTFMKEYPHVKLNVFYKPMIELMEMLQHRELDFVLAFRPSVHYSDIESHTLFDNQLAAIVRKGHQLAEKKSVSIAELEKYDIALPAEGLQARSAFDALRNKYFPQLNVKMELNEVNILLKLVRQSNLVTILSEATINGEDGITALTLDCPGNQMEGCVHTLKKNYRKRSMLEFIKMLEESDSVRERRKLWL